MTPPDDLYAVLARLAPEPASPVAAGTGTYETKMIESQDEDDATSLLGRNGL